MVNIYSYFEDVVEIPSSVERTSTLLLKAKFYNAQNNITPSPM